MDNRELAQEGYDQICTAILGVLRDAPHGLANIEIVNALSLESEFQGMHHNYLTLSILGNLLRDEKIRMTGSGRNRRYHFPDAHR